MSVPRARGQRRAEEQVACVLVAGQVALGRQEGLQRGVGARAADGPEVAVDLVRVGKLLDVRRVVGGSQGREHPRYDVAADRAELGDEARGGGPAEAVVVGDHGRGVPAGLVVEDVPETGVPLGAVAVEPEEVRRLDDHGGLLGTGDAVEERHVGMILGVVRDGDALVARERPDHHVGAVLLDDLANLLNDAVGRVVAAADADNLDGHAGDHGTAESLQRAGGRVRRPAREGDERQRRTGHDVLVERAEGALALAEDAEAHDGVHLLHRLRLRLGRGLGLRGRLRLGLRLGRGLGLCRGRGGSRRSLAVIVVAAGGGEQREHGKDADQAQEPSHGWLVSHGVVLSLMG